MPTLVEVLAIQTNPRAIIPCIRISRGIYVASTDYRAAFQLEMSFSYVSGGKPQRVQSTQTLGSMSLHSRIDDKNLDVHATEIAAPPPDTSSTVTAAVRLFINEASGTRVDVTDALLSNPRVTQ